MPELLQKKIDLSDEDLLLVRRILQVFLPDREVRAFGSRVAGNARKFSDLDLVVMGDTPLSFRERGGVTAAFEASYLPIRVDLLEWASVSPKFREIIDQNYIVVQCPAPATV